MRSRAKRPTKAKIDRILDPNRIADVINDAKSNTEADYGSSNLDFYLNHDTWEADDALILLCGIDPHVRDIDFDDGKFVKIHSAYFIGRPTTYDVPSRDDIYGWIDECNEEFQAFVETNGIVPPEPPRRSPWA